MARRLFALPLALVVVIAVFSSTCFATSLPPNNYDGVFDILVTQTSASTWTFKAQSYDIGTLNGFFFRGLAVSSGNYANNTSISWGFSFDLPLANSIYVAVKNDSYNNNKLVFDSLSSFRDPSLDFQYSVPSYTYSSYTYRGSVSGSSYTKDSSSYLTGELPVTFVAFRNVPAGSYSVLDSTIVYNTNYTSAVAGVFIAGDTLETNPSLSVDAFIDGTLSFSDALSNIGSVVQSNISNTDDIYEKIFEVSRGNFELDRLVQVSNNESLHHVQQTIIPGFNETINDYVSGGISLDDALSDMSQQYTAALNSAETPEQGTFINTSYQIKLQQFELEARRQAAAKVDSAISDDQLSEADDYYESEEELINLFDVAQFESALDFELWFNTLPPSEATQYKRFFDYILNDSSIRMFLVIPISLVLVRILLGTVLRLRVRHD